MNAADNTLPDPRTREAAVMLQVYGQLPFMPTQAAGCDLVTTSGRRILDFWGGHAVAALGHGHPRLVQAICKQTRQLMF